MFVSGKTTDLMYTRNRERSVLSALSLRLVGPSRSGTPCLLRGPVSRLRLVPTEQLALLVDEGAGSHRPLGASGLSGRLIPSR